VITSESDCRDAALSIGFTFSNSAEIIDEPVGCNFYSNDGFDANGKIWYNFSGQGSANVTDSPLCRAKGLCLTDICSTDAECPSLEKVTNDVWETVF
jgi:hypothetical protein